MQQLGRELLNLAKGLGIEPGDFGLRNNQFVYLSLAAMLTLIVLIILWFVIRQQNSRIGRAFSSIRMDEKAAKSMGINLTYYKVLAFAQGAFIAGLAGALYAHTVGYISPSDFSYHRAVEILIFTVFGGSEVVIGSVFGATILTLLPEALRFLSDYRYIFYGIMLVILMAVRPQGILDLQLYYRMKGKNASEGGAANGP